MDNMLIFIPILVGSIFIIAGLITLVFPPKKINGLYGYRTRNSKNSQERWIFAQKYAAKELIRSGGLLWLSSTIGLVYKPSENIATGLAIVIMFAILGLLFFRVETAIKKKFPKTPSQT